MILVLEIIGQHAGKFGLESRKVFNACGGTIGRATSSDWVLPDPHVSARHAEVVYADDQFLIIDRSTNGVCLNTKEERIARGEPYALNSGDRLFIDEYEILVTLLNDAGLGKDPVNAPVPHNYDPLRD